MSRRGSSGGAKAFICLIAAAIAAACAAVFFLKLYYPLAYYDIVKEYSSEYELPPALVYAVIHAESKFKEDAVSPKNAAGLMQLTEGTAIWLAGELGLKNFNTSKIFQPDVNIRLGCYYLQRLKKQYGSLDVALCAYNAGSGNVDKWLKNPEYSDDGKLLIYIPFAETRKYVSRVNNNQKIYGYLIRLRAFGARLTQDIER